MNTVCNSYRVVVYAAFDSRSLSYRVLYALRLILQPNKESCPTIIFFHGNAGSEHVTCSV